MQTEHSVLPEAQPQTTGRPISPDCLRGLSDVDFRAALVFVAVIEMQGIIPAARALDLSVPSVSSSLTRFRSQHARPLFTRTGRALEPTEEAHTLARQLGTEFSGLYAALSRGQTVGFPHR